jgi:hypothetical protein
MSTALTLLNLNYTASKNTKKSEQGGGQACMVLDDFEILLLGQSACGVIS